MKPATTKLIAIILAIIMAGSACTAGIYALVMALH